jgi:hypothetical protein
MTENIPAIMLIVILVAFIGHQKLASMANKKPSRTMDTMNLHRGGWVVNRSYSDSAEVWCDNFFDPTNRPPSEDEGEELKPNWN